MLERNDGKYPPPTPGERFSYVVVKQQHEFKYDLKGNKSTSSVGDRMEYYEYALEHNLKPDLNHYISSGDFFLSKSTIYNI